MTGVKPFADKCTGWEAKYEVIRGRGEQYVKREFSQKVFTDAELTRVVQQAIEDSVKDLEQIENELAFALEEQLVGETITDDKKTGAIESFRFAMQNLRGTVVTETGQAITSTITAEIVAYLAFQTATSLGISSTVIGASVAFSWGTFGVSLIVGFMVDYLWNWYDDPAGDIRQQTNTELAKMSGRLTSTVQGELGKFLEQRAGLWDKIVESK